MKKRTTCAVLSCMLALGAYIPCVEAEVHTMYAPDGRTLAVDVSEIELYKSVGWYYNESDVEVITMYAPDGRTIDILRAERDAYKNVGWYDTAEEVSITMYSTDGRTIRVFRDEGEAYRAVNWYYNIEDVTIIMYDNNGNEHRVYKDNIQSAKDNGWSENKSDVMQLMFAADGRTIYVPKNEVEAYMNVGWYRGGGTIDPSRPMVAITFDDGPGAYTDKILNCLEKYGAHATFFVQGQSVGKYATTVSRAVSLGCEIGNHTWNHTSLKDLSADKISSQITSTNNAIYNAIGAYPKLYRPPYGSYSKTVLAAIPSMPAILWSVDTLDWKTRNASKTCESVFGSTKDGSIILMHDIHSPTADAVETIVPGLLMRGYQLVTVSELISIRRGSISGGVTYSSVK